MSIKLRTFKILKRSFHTTNVMEMMGRMKLRKNKWLKGVVQQHLNINKENKIVTYTNSSCSYNDNRIIIGNYTKKLMDVCDTNKILFTFPLVKNKCYYSTMAVIEGVYLKNLKRLLFKENNLQMLVMIDESEDLIFTDDISTGDIKALVSQGHSLRLEALEDSNLKILQLTSSLVLNKTEFLAVFGKNDKGQTLYVAREYRIDVDIKSKDCLNELACYLVLTCRDDKRWKNMLKEQGYVRVLEELKKWIDLNNIDKIYMRDKFMQELIDGRLKGKYYYEIIDILGL